jgi:hypothetical protein
VNTWLKIKNYKCFGDDPQGFENIAKVNVIVGRNNSGKSAMLDLVAYAVAPYDLPSLRGASRPEVLQVGPVEESDYRATFPSGQSLGETGDFEQYGRRFIGKRMMWRVTKSGNDFLEILDGPKLHDHFRSTIVSRKKSPLSGKRFRRLVADRDIRPESSARDLTLKDDGTGATNLIQRYLNDSELPSSLIEDVLLGALNRVFEPDASFQRIRVQQLADDRWEVFVDEESKGTVALSNSGSGLKTVILVMLLLHVVPHAQKHTKLADYVYALEELENNLHPALQRRLIAYLRDVAERHGALFFLTTHSTVAIDVLSRDEHAQILHVTHDRHASYVRQVREYAESRAVLDDLDLRASDILQSNGVVWVEGPSDRVYFRRWVEVWSDGELQEGIHYQCLFYGGKLLKHLSCDEPSCDPSRVKILSVNRNAMILMDSDLRDDQRPLPATKTRIVEEMMRIGGLAWVTHGKEIENYIPAPVLTNMFALDFTRLRKNHVLWRYVDRLAAGVGAARERDKISFAEEVTPHLTTANLAATYDLASKLDDVCARIRRWNGHVVPGAG